MKPAWFDYYAPRSLDEALRILADAGSNGRVLAGGQSLMPMLNCRLLNPDVLVDINRIEALNRLDVTADTLTVGALVRHADLLHDKPGAGRLALAVRGDQTSRPSRDQESRHRVRQRRP